MASRDNTAFKKALPFISLPVVFGFSFMFMDLPDSINIYYSLFWGICSFLFLLNKGTFSDRVAKTALWSFVFLFSPWAVFGISLADAVTRQLNEAFMALGAYSLDHFLILSFVSLIFYFSLYFMIEKLKLSWISFGISAILSLYIMSLYQSGDIHKNLASQTLTVLTILFGASLMLGRFKDKLFAAGKKKIEKNYDAPESNPPVLKNTMNFEDVSSVNTPLPTIQSDMNPVSQKTSFAPIEDVAPSKPKKIVPFVPISMDEGPETFADSDGRYSCYENDDGTVENFQSPPPFDMSGLRVVITPSSDDQPDSDDDDLDNQLDEVNEDNNEQKKILLDSIHDFKNGDLDAEEFFNRFSNSPSSVFDSVVLNSTEFFIQNMRTAINAGDSESDIIDLLRHDYGLINQESKSDESKTDSVSNVVKESEPIVPAATLVSQTSVISGEDIPETEEVVPLSDDYLKDAYGSSESSSNILKWKKLKDDLSEGLSSQMDQIEYDEIVANTFISDFKENDEEYSTALNSLLLSLRKYDGTPLRTNRSISILGSLIDGGVDVSSVHSKGAKAFGFFMNQIVSTKFFDETGVNREKYLSLLSLCLLDKDLSSLIDRATHFSKNKIQTIEEQDEAVEIASVLDTVFHFVDRSLFMYDSERTLSEAFASAQSEAVQKLSKQRVAAGAHADFLDAEVDDEKYALDRASAHAILLTVSPLQRHRFKTLEGVLNSIEIFENRIDSDAIASQSILGKFSAREDNRAYDVLQRLKKEAVVCIDEMERDFPDLKNIDYVFENLGPTLGDTLKRIRETREDILSWSTPEIALSNQISDLDREIEEINKNSSSRIESLEAANNSLRSQLQMNQVEIAVKDLAELLRDNTNSVFDFSNPQLSAVRLWYSRSSAESQENSSAFCLVFFHGSNQPWFIKDSSILSCSSLAVDIPIQSLVKACAESQTFSMFNEISVRIILVGASSFDARSDKTVYQIESIMLDETKTVLKSLLSQSSSLGEFSRSQGKVKAKVESM